MAGRIEMPDETSSEQSWLRGTVGHTDHGQQMMMMMQGRLPIHLRTMYSSRTVTNKGWDKGHGKSGSPTEAERNYGGGECRMTSPRAAF